MRVAVVGGGITGISIAYNLAKSNRSVTLFERSPRLGGLVGSFRMSEVWLEKYFHHIFLSDTSVRKRIAELDLEKDLMWKVSPMGFVGDGRIFPFNGPLDLLSFSYLSFADRFRLGWNLFKTGKRHNGMSLDSISAKEWVERSWGGEIYQRFWGPLLRSKFSDAADQISAAWLWGRIYARANSRKGTQEKLGYLRGGFVRILEGMAKEATTRGAELRLHENVVRVEPSSRGWNLRTDRDTTYFDQVILAIPSPKLLEIVPGLPKEERRVHSGISYVAILCMPILMNRPLSDTYWLNVGDPSIPFTGVIEQTNFVPKEDYDGFHVAYLFNYLPPGHAWLTETKLKIFARYEEGLKRIFPQYRRDQVKQIMIFRDPYANVIYNVNYGKSMPSIASKLSGLYFANTAHIFPQDRNMNFSIDLADRVTSELSSVTSH